MKSTIPHLVALALVVTGCAAIVKRSKPRPPAPPVPILTAKAITAASKLRPDVRPYAETQLLASMIPASASIVEPTFRIISQTPVRLIKIPGVVTSVVCGVCVLTPSNANYQVQISTNNLTGPWRDRLGFTANNGATSCWNVPLQFSETNKFFLRCRLQPAAPSSTMIQDIRKPVAWVNDGRQVVGWITNQIVGLMPPTPYSRPLK